jgi:hypothetical protein
MQQTNMTDTITANHASGVIQADDPPEFYPRKFRLLSILSIAQWMRLQKEVLWTFSKLRWMR